MYQKNQKLDCFGWNADLRLTNSWTGLNYIVAAYDQNWRGKIPFKLPLEE